MPMTNAEASDARVTAMFGGLLSIHGPTEYRFDEFYEGISQTLCQVVRTKCSLFFDIKELMVWVT